MRIAKRVAQRPPLRPKGVRALKRERLRRLRNGLHAIHYGAQATAPPDRVELGALLGVWWARHLALG